MVKTPQNLKASEDFVRQVLSKNFHQTIDEDRLRAAAEKLCEVIPPAPKLSVPKKAA